MILTKDDLRAIDKRIEKHIAVADIRTAKGLNELHGKFDVVHERIDSLEVKMDKRFAEVDSRFAEVDKRFNKVDERFDAVDQRFNILDEKIDNKFDTLLFEIRKLSGQHRKSREDVTNHDKRLKKIERRLKAA